MPDDSVFDDLRGAGELDSEGVFTIDHRRMREKMRRFQLERPGLWTALLVSVAVQSGARRFDIDVDVRGRLVFEFDGNPLDLRLLHEVLHGDSGGDRRTNMLAAALAQIVETEHWRVDVYTFDGRQGAHLRIQEGRERLPASASSLWVGGGLTTRVFVNASALYQYTDIRNVLRRWSLFAPLALPDLNPHGYSDPPIRTSFDHFLVVRHVEPEKGPLPFQIQFSNPVIVQRVQGNTALVVGWGGTRCPQVAVVDGQAFDISRFLGLPGVLCVLGDNALTTDLSYASLREDEQLRAHMDTVRQEVRHMAEGLADCADTLPAESLPLAQTLLERAGAKRDAVRTGALDEVRRQLVRTARDEVTRDPVSCTLPETLRQLLREAARAGSLAASCDEVCRLWVDKLLEVRGRWTPDLLHAALAEALEARSHVGSGNVPYERYRLALLSQAAGYDARASGEVTAALEALTNDLDGAPLHVDLIELRSLLERAQGRRQSAPLHARSSAPWRRIVEADRALADGQTAEVAAMASNADDDVSAAWIDTVVDALRVSGRAVEAVEWAEKAMQRRSPDDKGNPAARAERMELLAALRSEARVGGVMVALGNWWQLRQTLASVQRFNQGQVRAFMHEGDDRRAEEYQEAGRRLEALLAKPLSDDEHLIEEARALQLRLGAIGCGHMAMYADVTWLLVRALRHARRFAEADRAVARLHMAERLETCLRRRD